MEKYDDQAICWCIDASDDIRADWKRLKEAGVEFIEDPAEDGDLSIATLKDPEGNLVQLFQYRPS